LLETIPGIERVLDEKGKKEHHINHERAGELVCIADKDSWFTYYYWEDDRRAPDFARTVDIHKKPGYDPAEMFFDRKKKMLFPRIVIKLLRKKLGFRTVMDLISLDSGLVKGSHGRIDTDDVDKPVFISTSAIKEKISAIDVCPLVLNAIFGEDARKIQQTDRITEKEQTD